MTNFFPLVKTDCYPSNILTPCLQDLVVDDTYTPWSRCTNHGVYLSGVPPLLRSYSRTMVGETLNVKAHGKQISWPTAVKYTAQNIPQVNPNIGGRGGGFGFKQPRHSKTPFFFQQNKKNKKNRNALHRSSTRPNFVSTVN